MYTEKISLNGYTVKIAQDQFTSNPMKPHTYTPRRASLKRWLASAPVHILDCFDDGENCQHADRFTILFTGPGYLMTKGDGPRTYASAIIPYLACSERPNHPQGFGQYGEFSASQAAAFRYRNGKRRVRWLNLPESVRKACL